MRCVGRDLLEQLLDVVDADGVEHRLLRGAGAELAIQGCALMPPNVASTRARRNASASTQGRGRCQRPDQEAGTRSERVRTPCRRAAVPIAMPPTTAEVSHANASDRRPSTTRGTIA